MSEPTRVLQVVTKMDRGGLESFVMNMYRNIDRSRIQFDFLCHREGRFVFDEEIRDLGGRIYHVPRANPFNFAYRRALDAFFEDHPYSVVHSHIDCMSVYPLAAARRAGAKVRIAHAHSSSQDKDWKYPLKEWSKRRIPSVATHLFACGEQAGRWMFRGEPFRVINNGVDVGRFEYNTARRKAARQQLGLAADTFVVGHVGRFDVVKNQHFLLQVFASLVCVRPDSRLLMVGDGPLREEAIDLSRSLGISDMVQFLGLRSDVADLMQAFDLFCLPSRYEGLPLVLVEAQAAGLPCVVADSVPRDCEIIPELVHYKSLREGPEQWVSALSEAPVPARRDACARLVQAAGYDAPQIARELQDFYLDVQ